jgi:hypothetical protein
MTAHPAQAVPEDVGGQQTLGTACAEDCLLRRRLIAKFYPAPILAPPPAQATPPPIGDRLLAQRHCMQWRSSHLFDTLDVQ